MVIAEHVNVAEKAREANEATESNDEAAALLEQWAREDRELWDAITDRYITRLCRLLVRYEQREHRRDAWTPRSDPTPDDTSGLFAVARQTLMDYPLSGNRRLGDMGRDGLLEEAASYHKMAASLLTRKRWLLLVAEQTKPGKAVRDCLSESQLEALQRRAMEA